MRKIIAQYIKRCEQCEKYKPAKENTKANLQPIKSTRTMELIEIDFIGPLTTTKRGNKYILTIVDHFSKFAIAYSTERQDTETVISCLNNYFSKYGPVERILSDQGRSFFLKEFLSFLKLWNITKSTSTSYHPQTQGLVERFNKTIIEILKKYVSEEHDTWDESVDMATYAYNTSIQRTTEMTPYEVIFGRKIKYLEKIKNETTQSEYVERLQKNHNKIEKILNDRQEIVRGKAKEKYDKKAGNNFNIGENVMLFNPAVKLGESKKFSAPFRGPYEIVSKQGEINYTIKPL